MKIIFEKDEVTGVSHKKPCGLLCDLSAVVAVSSLFVASFYGGVWFGVVISVASMLYVLDHQIWNAKKVSANDLLVLGELIEKAPEGLRENIAEHNFGLDTKNSALSKFARKTTKQLTKIRREMAEKKLKSSIEKMKAV